MKRKIQYMVCADCRLPLSEGEVRFYTTKTSDTIFKTSYCEDCFEKRNEAQRKLERDDEMSVLKVTEVQSEEVVKKDEVVAGQVRMTPDRQFTVLIVNATHNYMLSRLAESPEDKFVSLNLERPEDFGTDRVFILDENESLRTAKSIARYFPILLDAELTYKEAE